MTSSEKGSAIANLSATLIILTFNCSPFLAFLTNITNP
jgi:hypothetical protein